MHPGKKVLRQPAGEQVFGDQPRRGKRILTGSWIRPAGVWLRKRCARAFPETQCRALHWRGRVVAVPRPGEARRTVQITPQPGGAATCLRSLLRSPVRNMPKPDRATARQAGEPPDDSLCGRPLADVPSVRIVTRTLRMPPSVTGFRPARCSQAARPLSVITCAPSRSRSR